MLTPYGCFGADGCQDSTLSTICTGPLLSGQRHAVPVYSSGLTGVTTGSPLVLSGINQWYGLGNCQQYVQQFVLPIIIGCRYVLGFSQQVGGAKFANGYTNAKYRHFRAMDPAHPFPSPARAGVAVNTADMLGCSRRCRLSLLSCSLRTGCCSFLG